MPMIDLTFPEGALSEEALDGLADSLMRALLRSEHVPEDNAARELVSWVHMHELPARRIYAGARRLEAGEPFFRLDISIPAGVVGADDKAAFIAEATRLVLEAAGADADDREAAARVWILYREVPGGWGASGRLLSLRQIAKIVGGSEERAAQAEAALTG
jgi:phenylpyruvate tautomerase PptA (4-oxalocrotonate tautomerase family)